MDDTGITESDIYAYTLHQAKEAEQKALKEKYRKHMNNIRNRRRSRKDMYTLAQKEIDNKNKTH